MRKLPLSVDDILIQELKEELSRYKVAVADFPPTMDVIRWWRNQLSLPGWRRTTVLLLHLTPSSVAVERVFSLMKAYVSDQQCRMLDDQLQLVLMLQYYQSKLSHAL